MKKNVFILITCLVISTNIFAQIIPASLTQRVKNAQTMAIGKVVEKQSYWDVDKHNIWTLNILEVRAYLKTNLNQLPSKIAIITSGGIVGYKGQHTCPSFDFQTNNEYFVFLDADNLKVDNKNYRETHPDIPQCEPYASVQGVLGYYDGKYYDAMSEPPISEIDLLKKLNQQYNLTTTQPNGKIYAPRPTPQYAALLGSISSWQDGSAGSGPFIAATILAANELIINGTGFGATAGTVEFDHVDDGLGIGADGYATTITSDIVSWSDVQIRTKIPSKAGTGIFRVKDNLGTVVATSASNISIKWAQINLESSLTNFATSTRQQVKFINQDGTNGYTFQYSTVAASGNVFSTNTPAKEAFERSLLNWRCATFVNFKLSATTTSVGPANDDICSVSFNPALAANVLGSCITRFGIQSVSGTCEMHNTLIYVSELDVQMSPDGAGLGWNYGTGATTGNKIDFESVMLHELGHGHGCDHINDNATAMYFSVSVNTDKRVLSTNEIECGDFRLNNSTSAFCVTPFGGKQPIVKLVACVLPVELLDFTAVNKTDKNLLNWQTVTERHNSHFVIQKSKDGQGFVDIGTVKGGTTNTPQYYAFSDESPFNGINYYRLKQVDNDGKEDFSKVVSVTVLVDGKKGLRVYPNPTHHVLTVEHTPSVQTLEIVNTLGQVLKVIKPLIDARKTEVGTAELANGIYFLRINQNEMIRFTKL
jgi:Secretion system C-terminal sorting domain